MAKHMEPITDNAYNRRMAEGHKRRTGHDLVGYQASDDGVLWHTIRECCGETEPEKLTGWQ